ncbi:TetR/AcrR family transcriptional regulator [Marinilactibacillus sp. XAAS-LB27]|uniref:TetR/AcrR family transcriptional regulator n=1 Tax=Marinilactibacillus sp. XAAS-LB27 TaxID=3114538 RepID=UPI002E170937|nr:TetR/AcrR family transcriptional regulator [Marinilactibacillus sp. XAAS-LB27]
MPRQRTILRENILDASMELLRSSGFSQFTARQIAIKMNSSTQPIYKEFKNMEDLKVGLLEYIKQYLSETVFNSHHTTDPLEEVCEKYILFAKKEPTLFSAIYMDRELEVVQLHNYSYEMIEKILKETDSEYDEKNILPFLNILWPSVLGVAMLVAQGKIQYDQNQINQKVKDILNTSLTLLA